MADFYFFTEPDKLTTQTSNEAFGPSGTSAGMDTFNISSLHQTPNSLKAFAICSGMICVQEIGTGVVNLILKPSHQPENDLPFVSYYIYKGIKASSLWDSSEQILSTGNDLVDLIQKSADANNVPNKNTLGANLTASKSATLYGDNAPIDNLFYKGDSDYPLHFIKSGMHLGDFVSAPDEFGLTIILERIGYHPALELARKIENQIKVPSYSGATTPPNNAAYFEHWHKKEEILNFLDPCFFWGSFGEKQLKAWDGSTHKGLSYDEVYTKVLKGTSGANFYNRQSILLDIRSEHSGSLNYYKNYGNIIRLSTDAGVTFTDVDYYQAGWPWYLISVPGGLASGQTVLKLELALPKSDNTLPLIYLSQVPGKESLGDPVRFVDVHRLSFSDYVTTVHIYIPIITDVAPCFRAAIARLMYFRRIDKTEYVVPPIPAATTLLYQEHLDYIFQPLGMNLPFGAGKLGIKIYYQEVFVDKTQVDGTQFIGYAGICEDSANYTFFVFPVRSTGRGNLRSIKGYARVTTSDSFGTAQSFLEYLHKVYGHFFIRHGNTVNGQTVSTYSVLYDKDTVEKPSVLIFSKTTLNTAKAAISVSVNLDYSVFLRIKVDLGAGPLGTDNISVFDQQLVGFNVTSLVENTAISIQEKGFSHDNS